MSTLQSDMEEDKLLDEVAQRITKNEKVDPLDALLFFSVCIRELIGRIKRLEARVDWLHDRQKPETYFQV